MRKSSKVILTLTGLFFTLGIILIIVGILSGGKFRNVTIWGGDYEYVDIEETFDAQVIKNLEIDVDADDVKIVEGDSFRLVGKNVVKNSISTGVRGSTLYIKENKANWYERIGFFIDTKQSELTLYIPSNFVAEHAELEVDAGIISIDTFSAKSMTLEVSAGKAELNHVTVSDKAEFSVGAGSIMGSNNTISNMNVDVDAGACKLSGTFDQKIKLECDAGSLRLDTSLTEEEYNYDLDRDVGSISVNGESYSDYKHRDNDATNEIKADCSIGSININTK